MIAMAFSGSISSSATVLAIDESRSSAAKDEWLIVTERSRELVFRSSWNREPNARSIFMKRL